MEQINSKHKIYVAGISVIDLSTGKNKIFQINSLMDDNNLCLDELYRFINIHNPREIIIYSKNLDLSKDELVRYLEIDNKVCHLILNEIDPNIEKLSYQSEFLQKIFPNTGLLSVIEYLDLEKTTYGLISYIFLLAIASIMLQLDLVCSIYNADYCDNALLTKVAPVLRQYWHSTSCLGTLPLKVTKDQR